MGVNLEFRLILFCCPVCQSVCAHAGDAGEAAQLLGPPAVTRSLQKHSSAALCESLRSDVKIGTQSRASGDGLQILQQTQQHAEKMQKTDETL